MSRILLLDDDPDHALLLEVTAEQQGGELVGTVSEVDELGAAVVAHEPDVVFVDAWLRDGSISLDRADEIAAAVGDLPVVVWTHDPWTAGSHPGAAGYRVLDKLAPVAALRAALQGVSDRMW